jgi:GINS complex subunit 1
MAGKAQNVSDPGPELLRDIKAIEASSTANIGAFDERRVRDIAQRINNMDADLHAVLSNPHVDLQDPYYSALPVYLRASIVREKRCLVTYLKWRLERLSGLWWMSREQVALASSATQAETEFVRQYNAMMVEYMQTFPVAVDLRSYTSRPPCFPPTNIVEVRGLKAHTFVSPLSGRVLQVYPGKLCSFSVEDAEVLVQQEVAEYVT